MKLNVPVMDIKLDIIFKLLVNKFKSIFDRKKKQ